MMPDSRRNFDAQEDSTVNIALNGPGFNDDIKLNFEDEMRDEGGIKE